MTSSLEERIAEIEKRNLRVEKDKAWETSWARRLSISILTYIVAAGYLVAIGNHQPFLNAFVPAIGFMLSTLVLKRIKDFWQA